MNQRAIVTKLKTAVRHPVRTVVKTLGRRHCWACGRFSARRLHAPYFTPAELIIGHEYTPEWAGFMREREAKLCWDCGANGRSRQVAKALVDEYAVKARSLAELVHEPGFRSLAIAEINQCAQLHYLLADLPGLHYSEYGSLDPEIRSEDTLNLSYSAGSFDLVLTSDTLEHVPDSDRALAEIHRVLKPGGSHIFTIPVVWDQPRTRKRSVIEDGRLVHLLPPVYHGGSIDQNDCLAFYDYGADIVDTVRSLGFDVELVEDRSNRALKTIVTRRTG